MNINMIYVFLYLFLGSMALDDLVMPEPVYGLSYGELNMKWWNRVFGLPPDQNPLLDDTGAHCDIAQAGPVYYLHGTWSPTGTAHRTCSVPCNKAIFIPLCNVRNDNSPGFDENGNILLSFNKHDLINDLKDFNDLNCAENEDLEVIVDGVSVTDLLDGPAPQYWYDTFLPEINIWQYFGLPVEAGIYKANSDGRVIVLKPLSAGEHTVYFSAGFYSVDYTLNVQSCSDEESSEKRSLETHMRKTITW
jgi:hypothetical protein